MTIFSFKLYVRQLKRYRILLIILIIFWTYTTVNAPINNINDQVYNIDRNWKRDAGEPTTTPITTNTFTPTTTSTTKSPINISLTINLTFEQSLMQWSFPLQVGTPPQTLKIAIDTTYNLLWIVSELCMSPFGNASSGQTTNFYNTSLSNDSATDYEEFTIKYINGAELESIWAKSTVLINNQTHSNKWTLDYL
ncbi:hypothetical protein C2G38_2192728 [Gigaspora rosea]|uniref:Peptidase A1 domain-containing protein n=1 Tax=Gigaspora rosea TaxID=44941 RepID=A0A397V1K4_9GLOM|nr:hypothetical protein C2G38_2192728 [Gigaspora rosea]